MARFLNRGRRPNLFARPVPGTAASSRVYFVVILVGLASMLQSSLSSGFEVFGVIPDLVLVFLATWAAVARPRRIMLWGFGAGFLLDVLSGAPVGTNMLALTAATFIASMGGAGLFRTSLIWALMAVFLATIAYYPIMMLLLATHGRSLDWGHAIGATAPAAVAVNIMACVFLYRPVSALERFTRERQPYRTS